jgi:hypothetical protein
MPGPQPARCNFPDDFVQEALDTVRRRTAAVQVVQRFRLALLLHEQPDIRNEDAAKAVGFSLRHVDRGLVWDHFRGLREGRGELPSETGGGVEQGLERARLIGRSVPRRRGGRGRICLSI